MIRGNSSFFITGGTLGQDTPSYVERRADAELYEGLRQGEFCYVLTARQMGKSSLMVRTANRLRGDGFAVVTLDLTMVGQNLTLEQWYYGLLNLTGRQLGLRPELRAFWVAHPELGPLQRFMLALEQVVLASLTGTGEEEDAPATPRPAGLVVFVDEIDSVLSLPFSTDELFAAIRQCYNRRAEEPTLQRLTFCLLGVTSPSQLIRDARTTPFNVGRRIELHDFREPEARPLAVGLQLGTAGDPLRTLPVAQHLLRRVLHWTAGHPYLTQRLCQAVAEDPKARDARAVDRICRSLFLTSGARHRDDNLLFVQERLVNREDDVAAYLDLYRRIRASRRVRSDETDPRVPELRLSGIVREERGYLRVRNRIYHQVFDAAWIKARMPDAEIRRRQAAYRYGLIRGIAGSTTLLALLGGLALGVARQGQRVRRLTAIAELDRGVRALQAGDQLGLLNLLEGCRLAESDPELREGAQSLWRGWHSTVGHPLSEILDPGAPLTSLAMSGNGRLLAVGREDGSVQIWDTATWQPVTRPPATRPGQFRNLVFSPDNRQLAVLRDRTVSVWDRAGTLSERLLRFDGEATSAGFLAGGAFLAIQTSHALQVWSVRYAEEPPARLILPDRVTTTAYSPAQNGALAFATPSGVWLYDPVSRLKKTLSLGNRYPIFHLAFSEDGRLLALASLKQAWVWDVARGRLQSLPLGSSARIEGLACDGQSQLVATWGATKAQLWSATSGAAVGQPYDHGSTIRAVRFGGERERYVATLSSARIRFWRATEPVECAPSLAPLGGLARFACDAQMQRLAGTSTSRDLRVWRLEVPDRTAKALLSSPTLQEARFAGNGETLVAADQFSYRGWSTTNALPLGERVSLQGSGGRVAISPDGHYVATSITGRTRCWDRATGQATELPIGREEGSTCLAFSPSGALLAQGSPARRIWLWALGSGTSLRSPLNLREVPQRIELSANDRYLVAASRRLVELCDLQTGKVTALRMPGAIRWLGFIAAGEHLAVVAGNQVVRIQPAQPESRPQYLALNAEAAAATADRQGRRLAVATTDNELTLCDVQRLRVIGAPLRQTDRAHVLAFSPDGELLASDEGLVRMQLWSLSSRQRYGPPLTFREPILRLDFRADGGQLAIQTETAVQVRDLYRGPLSIAQIELMTWVSLDARNTTHGIEAIPSVEWRLMRDRLRSTTR